MKETARTIAALGECSWTSAVERLTPEPEPPRKMTPSRRIQSRIGLHRVVYQRMKHPSTAASLPKPTLNPDGELKAAAG